MLKDQFYLRLMLLMAVGVVYVKAYMNMAKHNSNETAPERHLMLKILGVFFAIIAVFFGCFGLYSINQISFPHEEIGPYISRNMIVRSSSQTLYWGYATFPQSQCISIFTGVFEFLALSAYCFMFKSSHSRWYTKVGKVVFSVLFYMFFVSATEFHYFDLNEWIAPIIFAIMAFFAFRNKHEEITEPVVEETKEESSAPSPLQIKENIDNSSIIEDSSKYMPRIKIEEDVLTNSYEHLREFESHQQPEEMAIDEPSSNELKKANSSIISEEKIKNENIGNPTTLEQNNFEQDIRFCRYCGKKLDYESDKYCKHCGKKLY